MVCNLLSNLPQRCASLPSLYVFLAEKLLNADLFAFDVQGPTHIDQRVEAFLSKFENELRQLSEDEFKASKTC